MILAPRWVLSAQAIDGAGSPHLAPGVHLRLLPTPALGFPMAPFMVYRANLGQGARKWQLHSEITWTTLDGQPLTPPIQVTPGRPVVGHLPPPLTAGTCIWIDLLTGTAKPGITAGPQVDPVSSTLPIRRLPTPIAPIPRPIPRPIPIKFSLKVEAQVSGLYGPSTVASRSQPPYQLGASRIERILVSGRGTIQGALWLSAQYMARMKWEPWRLLALPVSGGARYAGLANAEEEAKDRVHRGAPLRLGLHDAPSVPDPAAAPPVTPADEWKRVEAAAPDVFDYVKRVVDDTSAPQPELLVQQDLYQDGERKGDVTVPVLGAMLQFGLDPGIGRFLGLCDRDESPPSTSGGDVVVYAIRALWSLDLKRLGEQIKWLPPKAISEKLPEITFRDWRVEQPKASQGPYLDLWTLAATTIGAPPDLPAPLALGTPENGNWLPSMPPSAIREAALPIAGAAPAAGLAVARHIGASFEPLNRKDKVGRRQLIFLGQDPEQSEPGNGTFWDGAAPPDPFAYRAAQADWFGRWSAWREVAVPDKARPAPPRPVIQATYTQPIYALPVPDAPLSGTVKVRVEVPPPASMAPGSWLLKHLELKVNGSTTIHALASPASPGPALEVSLPGPALARAGQGTAEVTGRWVNSLGTPSLEAEPVTLELYDPRPAVHLTFPNTLTYTSRPDVTGKARAILTWTPGAGHSTYRVYAADETGVRAKLAAIAADVSDPERAAAGAVLAGLDALSAPDRAARYRANRHLLRRAAFELLTGVALPAAGPQMRYEHTVSGSLRVLALYRVVPVSAAGVESDFAQAPLLTFGVPNSGAPAVPEVTVTPVINPAATVPYQVEVTVRVPRGTVPAARFRIRRTGARTMEPLTMPVIATGTVDAPASGTDQSFTFTDEGPWAGVAPSMRLKPWFAYYYGVEVQAPAEPGSAVEGDWSPLSPVAGAQMVPASPPAAATALTATDLGSATRIRFRHLENLAGGLPGPYQVQIYRQPAAGREALLTTLSGEAHDSAGWFQYDDATPERAGARYRVLVIDPIGRRGAPTAPVGL